MFSNKFNTSDLYFSNPIDHFLGQEQDFKASYESGFSSNSYRQTGNSTDHYRSSQDLFSQTENPDSQFAASNSDYQKYISQNLLLRKEDKPQFKRINKDNEKEKEKKLNHFQLEASENHLKEIKSSLSCLDDNIKTLNSDIRLLTSGIQDDMARYGKMSLMEKTLEKKIQVVSENIKSLTKCIRKQEDEKKELYNKISQIAKSTNNLLSKINDYKEHCDKTVQECVKKVAKNCEAYKKESQKMQDLCSQIHKTLCKVKIQDEALIKGMKGKLENVFDQKLKNWDDHMRNSINQAVQAIQIKESKSLVKELQSPQTKVWYQQTVTPKNSLFKTPRSKEYHNSSLHNENSNIKRSLTNAAVSSKHLIQTPLAQHMDNFKCNEKKLYQYYISPKGSSNIYTDKISSQNIKSKSKISTPLSKIVSPFNRQSFSKSTRPIFEPYPTKYYNNAYNQNSYNKNNIQKFSYVHYEKSEQLSSPGLTVYDAATITKGNSFYKRFK